MLNLNFRTIPGAWFKAQSDIKTPPCGCLIGRIEKSVRETHVSDPRWDFCASKSPTVLRVSNIQMETKKCKLCQSDIPLNAKKCPKCQGDLRNFASRHKIITTLLILFIIGSIKSGFDEAISPEENTPSQTQSSFVSVGEEGYLRLASQTNIVVALSKEALDDIVKSSVAKDDRGIAEVVAEGRAILVPAGTKVLVLSSPSLGVREVRVLDGAFINVKGFVPREFISNQ
jgi:hypothetical protein